MLLTKRALVVAIALLASLSLTTTGCGDKKSAKRGMIGKGPTDSKADPAGATGDDGKGGDTQEGDEHETNTGDQVAGGEEAKKVAEQQKVLQSTFDELLGNYSKSAAKSDLTKGVYDLKAITGLYAYNANNQTLKSLVISEKFEEFEDATRSKYKTLELRESTPGQTAGTMTDDKDAGFSFEVPNKISVKEDGKWAAGRDTNDATLGLVQSKLNSEQILSNHFSAFKDYSVPKTSILDILANGSAGSDGKIVVEDGKNTIYLTLLRKDDAANEIAVAIFVDTKDEDGQTIVSRSYLVTYSKMADAADSGAKDESTNDSGSGDKEIVNGQEVTEG